MNFETSMLKLVLCDYSDTYILVSGIIFVVGTGGDTAEVAADRNNRQAIFKYCAPFTNCITNE